VDDEYDALMAEALNQNQFRPGEGYTPSLPAKGISHFTCTSCGSRYVAPVKIDPAITMISNCRNRGCPGPVVRT